MFNVSVFCLLIMNILVMIYYRLIGILGNYIITIISMLLYLMSIYMYILLKGVLLISGISLMLNSVLCIGLLMVLSSLSVKMLWLISLICSIIIIYVKFYLNLGSNNISVYLNMFSLFMMLFSVSSLLIYNLIGYEIIGVISYILINYYVNKLQSNKCSLYSLLIGKLGDIGILYGIYSIMSLSMYYSIYNCSKLIIIISILVGIISKSAQYILLSWLILAMLGRTRVSGLLLSSTLVTSGLYWLIILKICNINIIIIMLSLCTILIIGVSSYLSYDMKRIIAYSTSSQMGFILIICNYNNKIGILLIITLGMNKALLFLSVGVMILCYKNIQEIRYYKNYNSISLILNILTTLNMIGFYSTLVYYSKELIIDYIDLKLYLYIKNIILLGSILTITYSIKLYLVLC